jgi:hypothetical protein
MKLLRDKRETNYAYNINNSPNSTKAKKISFNTLSKNFYEDLINSDSSIKSNRRTLNRIKCKSIKESVYSNKMVPSSWKIILGYQDQVYGVIDKDPAFAQYLGRSQKESNNRVFSEAQKLRNIHDPQNVEQKPIPDFIKKYLDKSEDKELHESEKTISKEAKVNDDKIEKFKFQRRPSQTFQQRLINEKNLVIIDDKLISSKLDEYRTKYDLNKYMHDIKARRNLDKEKKLNNLLTPNPQDREINYRQFLKTRTQNDKEHVLKSSIYYNLISKDNDNDINKLKTSLKKKNLKPIKPASIFLNHNKEFDKVIEITNPKIKRDLELINYYGPLYTHCKLCNNRNLEFYQNSEPNQTLKLLHYLKRIKLGEEKEDTKV